MLTRAEFEAAKADLAEPSVLPGGWRWETWHVVQPAGYAAPFYRAFLWCGQWRDTLEIHFAEIDLNRSQRSRHDLSYVRIEIAAACLHERDTVRLKVPA